VELLDVNVFLAFKEKTKRYGQKKDFLAFSKNSTFGRRVVLTNNAKEGKKKPN